MRKGPASLGVAIAATAALAAQEQGPSSFRGGVELINISATVTDRNGRFVAGLGKEDFAVFEDGEPQELAHFSNERVPVSLGLVLDASGSMTPDKMASARSAIDRLIHDLLGREDELFFMEFANQPHLTQEWTLDREAISRALQRVRTLGGTAMYDAIAEAIPTASIGLHPKKALLVISDGNDTNSRTPPGELRRLIRESEVLVYALGVDGTAPVERINPPVIRFPPLPRFPLPIPGGGPQRPRFPPVRGRNARAQSGERVDADALRRITDDTGGRTEIVRGFGDLSGATARIADELSRQYYLGYASAAKRDGRWHEIRVEVRGRGVNVRARRGYVAS
jgi:Ca-activated chloride channel family protein